MTKYTIENQDLRLELQSADRHLQARLVVKSTGFATPFVPLISLQIWDRMQERLDVIERYEVLQCELVEENTLHVIVRDVFRRLTVGIWLKMTADDLSILFPPAEVEEANERIYRLFAARLLPGLIGTGAEGKVFLPLAKGVLFSPAGKPALSDRFLIYGEQERWELLTTMPLCGVQGERGGWLVLGAQGASDLYCEVATDGRDGATVGLYPMFRKYWPDPMNWEQREIRIRALAPGVDLVTAAGQHLRRHIIEDLKKPTLVQRAKESPACAYQQSAYTMKLFHGIQQQGIMMYGHEAKDTDILYKRTLPFAEAARNFNKLKEAGVDRIEFQSVGWNPRGHDGAWPTDFPIDRRLGGETGFRAMIEEAKRLGFHITTHLNLKSACYASPNFNPDWVLHDIWGEPKVTGSWGGGASTNHWTFAIPEEFIRSRILRLKELGFNGVQYLDGMGNPLYVNYHPKHRGSRAAYAEGTNRLLKIAREICGASGTEMGYLYCAIHSDTLVGVGDYHLMNAKPEWPVFQLIEEKVPVLGMALHGLVTLENHGLDWPQTMRAILFGEVPQDEWSSEGNVMPILDGARIAKLKARYDLCCCEFGHLVTEQLVSWRRLATKVEETTFGDGTKVVADFANGHLTVNGKDVPRPEVLAK
ncbi:hypothetical protein BH09VER1_BH09VER1_36250 [soil metagenome]